MPALEPTERVGGRAERQCGIDRGIQFAIGDPRKDLLGVRAIVSAMLAFAVTTVVISFIHLSLFSFAEIADLLWFGWFIFATLVLALLTVRVWRM